MGVDVADHPDCVTLVSWTLSLVMESFPVFTQKLNPMYKSRLTGLRVEAQDMEFPTKEKEYNPL